MAAQLERGRMATEHRARITWSAAHVAHGLRAATHFVDPSWFVGDGPNDEGWSLVCRFEIAPQVQGNPSMAWVRFAMAGAPHERLVPGTVLRLFEPITGDQARVELVE